MPTNVATGLPSHEEPAVPANHACATVATFSSRRIWEVSQIRRLACTGEAAYKVGAGSARD